MNGPAFRLKPPGRPTHPGTIVSVFVETKADRTGGSDPRSRLRLFRRGHVAAVRWRRGKWTPIVGASFGTADGLWEWIHRYAQTKGLTYVFSPIASDTLTLLGGWSRIVRHRSEPPVRTEALPGRELQVRDGNPDGVRRMVLNGKPDIVQYSQDGKSICWLSGRQFFDNTTDEVRAMLGADAGRDDRGGSAVLSELREYRQDERTWLRALMKFADWFAGLNAGAFPRTVPNASMQFFRSRMPKSAIVVHTDEEVINLERRASHGGRASVWYLGDVGPDAMSLEPSHWLQPVPGRPWHVASAYQFDICSTYPFLLANNPFPVRRCKYTREHGPQDVRDMLLSRLAIASVQVSTEVPEYPHRLENEVIYPVGTFTTVLCGPELRRALDDGIVNHVYEVAYYEPGRPFATAAGELLAMRDDAKASGDKTWELMVKLLANSLGGKLSQRPLGWVRCPSRDCPERWGEEYARTADTGEVRKYRYINGLAFERRPIRPRNGTMLACFAFLTSYCRYKMRQIRELLPARSVFSQDTDGLWVDGVAASVLRNPAHGLASSRPGGLREVQRSRGLRLLGAKHYRSDSGWVLAGYSKPRVTRKGRVLDRQLHNPVRQGTRDEPRGVDECVRLSELADAAAGGWVGEDGWVTPYRLPVDRGTPEAAKVKPQPHPHLPLV